MSEASMPAAEQGEFLPRKSLREGVFELLHQRIVSGKYAPGEWLRQEEISSQLGVSQTPVREALDLLVSVGLAERVPFRGVRVPQWSQEEIVDAYVLRLLLESTAARLAAYNITPLEATTLWEVVEQTRGLINLEDMSQLRQLNRRFHSLIAEASQNSLLSKMYQMVSNLFPDWRLYEYMFRHPELLESSLKREYDEHCAIYEAIAEHQAEAAARQVVIHIRNLRVELVNYLGISEALIEERERQVAPLLLAPT